MSVWITNLRMALEDRTTLLLHGNVRDRYIDEHGRVYDNLTGLLTDLVRALPHPITEMILYDPVSGRRRIQLNTAPSTAEESVGAQGVNPGSPPTAAKEPSPTRDLAAWSRELRDTTSNRCAVLFYLDKLIGYKNSYSGDELQILLWLEKAIENITPNNRLILVALRDTMVPIEIYTHSPKVRLLPVPPPDKEDRERYIRHQLGEFAQAGVIADLTDGLYLHSLDRIAEGVRGRTDLSERDLRRVVNRYRIGFEEDYWGKLSIEDLAEAEARIGLSADALRLRDQERGAAGGSQFPDKVKAFDQVKGQDEAIRSVISILCLARSGLSGMASGIASKPKGPLFFAGPTGVGKTLVAKKLAKFLFGSEEAFIRFDMSEMKGEHTDSKLIGSPPGYVGYEQGGMLTNAVRERPFAVVLFDEIEKAHPKIMDIFLQLLDEGRLTDSRGQTVFFTETVVIFTSNLGCRAHDSRDARVDEKTRLTEILAEPHGTEKTERVRQHFVESVQNYFMEEISRPELLNRIGNYIVPFNYIQDPAVQREIVLSHLGRIQDSFQDRYRQSGYELEAEEPVIAHLIERFGTKMGEFGGRGITNAIETEVIAKLSRTLLRAEYDGRHAARFRLIVRDGAIDVELV